MNLLYGSKSFLIYIWQKNYIYVILNCKCMAKIITGQWTNIYGTGDQNVKINIPFFYVNGMLWKLI